VWRSVVECGGGGGVWWSEEECGGVSVRKGARPSTCVIQ
jgi:hypothetical protein